MREKQFWTLKTKSTSLKDNIESARLRLYEKLVNLNINSMDISEYNQRYLQTRLTYLYSALYVYSEVLYHALNNQSISLKNFVLVDYGGGTGIMSYLAAEMGIGTIIYNDIYDVSCQDVEKISKTIGLTLNHIIAGDVDELVSHLKKNSIPVNAIVSYDVLEHIYNVESHFKKLAGLSNNQLRIVYGSGANIANPFIVRDLRKKQIDFEFKIREKKWGHKERDALESFFDIRKNIISVYAPNLDAEDVEQLARSTRGLMQQDIEKCVDEFNSKGSITYSIDHPTNTCDPYTGNWCEHLLDFKWLEICLKRAGFSVKIIPGSYNTLGKTFLRRSIKEALNVMIKILGRRFGMSIAPYYIVYAETRNCLNE